MLGVNFFLAMLVYAVVGVGFGYVAPWAMVPDTIEYDAVRTGKRKEGAFYGMWTFTSKVGTSLAIFLTGVILDLARYVPNAVDQPESALTGIRLVIGPIPAAVFIAAMVLVQFYPIDEKVYAELMRQSDTTPSA